MSEFPLLPLPPPDVREPRPGRGFRPSLPHRPGRRRQGERLGPVFDRLAAILESDEGRIVLGDDPGALAPERVLVFEVAGSISDFAAACSRVPGLEYLAERESEFPPDEDFWILDTRKNREGQRRDDKLVQGRFYAAMPDVRALRQLLSLWRRYEAGEGFDHGFKKWFDLFDRLYDLRPWGPGDRVSEDTIVDFRQELADDPLGPITVEIEMWPRASPAQRDEARRRLTRVVEEARGNGG